MGRLASSRFALREEKKGGSLPSSIPCLFVTYVHSSVHITLGLLPRKKEKKTNFVWDGPKKGKREVESEGENSNESSALVSKVGGETILFFLRDLRTIVIPGPFGKTRNESCKNYLFPLHRLVSSHVH